MKRASDVSGTKKGLKIHDMKMRHKNTVLQENATQISIKSEQTHC